MATANLNPLGAKLESLKRQQAIADAITQQGLQPLQPRQVGAGRYQYTQAPSAFEGIAKVLQAGAGAYISNKTDDKYAEIAKQMQAERDAAGQKISGSTEIAPGDSQAFIDAGGDPQVLKMIQDQRDRRLADETARRGQDITSRGQDLGAQTTIRGQDIGAQTALTGQRITARGQDIGSNTAIRGQDLTAQTALRGQDLTAGTAAAGLANKGGVPTESETKNATLATRLKGALNTIDKADPSASSPGVTEKLLGSVGSEMGANLARSPDRQVVNAAQLDALDAALTLATGAAYTKEQLANIQSSYFPQIGDSPEAIASKKQRFASVVESANQAAGRARPQIGAALNLPQPAGGRGASGSYGPVGIGQTVDMGGFKVTRKQ